MFAISRFNFFHLSFVLLVFLAGSACSSLNVLSKEDIKPYLGQKTAFFVLKPDDPLPPELWKEITQSVEEGVRTAPGVAHLVAGKELDAIWKKDPELHQEQLRYSTTLMLTHISDKNLSANLLEKLQVSQFFVFQAENYPCSQKCSSDTQLLMRFLLLDGATGEVIYRMRFHQQLKDSDAETLQTLVQKTTQAMLLRFRSEFTLPWHRQRYEHLKKTDPSAT